MDQHVHQFLWGMNSDKHPIYIIYCTIVILITRSTGFWHQRVHQEHPNGPYQLQHLHGCVCPQQSLGRGSVLPKACYGEAVWLLTCWHVTNGRTKTIDVNVAVEVHFHQHIYNYRCHPDSHHVMHRHWLVQNSAILMKIHQHDNILNILS